MESSFSQIEAQALRLPPYERARLAESLFGSISEETPSDESGISTEEARRRRLSSLGGPLIESAERTARASGS